MQRAARTDDGQGGDAPLCPPAVSAWCGVLYISGLAAACQYSVPALLAMEAAAGKLCQQVFAASSICLQPPLPQVRATTSLPTFCSLLACSGLPERLVDPEAARLLKQLGLTEYADRACASYSGGNRRKLSVAVSCQRGGAAACLCCLLCCLHRGWLGVINLTWQLLYGPACATCQFGWQGIAGIQRTQAVSHTGRWLWWEVLP